MFEPAHIPEVCRAIVKGISVDVVTYLVFWSAVYATVHPNKRDFVPVFQSSTGIKPTSRFLSVPVKYLEDFEPLRVEQDAHSVLQLDKIKRSSRKRLNNFNQHHFLFFDFFRVTRLLPAPGFFWSC